MMKKYNSPITINCLDSVFDMVSDMNRSVDSCVLKAVMRCGVDIDEKSLVQALEQDKKRYTEAFERGRASAHEKAEWIKYQWMNGDISYKCSLCDEAFDLIEGDPFDNNYLYCPHCGAKMISIRELDDED